MPLKLEFELNQPPTDGITNVVFSPAANSPQLLCSSWDNSVRLFNVAQNSLQIMYTHQYSVLDCCFAEPTKAFSGGLDRTLKNFDFPSQTEGVLGTHEDAIRCVEYCPELGIVVTGSWDKTIKLWDPRQKHGVGTYDQNGELVYSMSLCGDRLVVATSNRRVLVWDLKNMQFAEQRRASSLKYQTRCIQCFPNKQGFVLSSIEGRVAVEYLDTDAEVQKKKYAFKCHRVKQEGTEYIYPVNAIAFHMTTIRLPLVALMGLSTFGILSTRSVCASFIATPQTLLPLPSTVRGTWSPLPPPLCGSKRERNHARTLCTSDMSLIQKHNQNKFHCSIVNSVCMQSCS